MSREVLILVLVSILVFGSCTESEIAPNTAALPIPVVVQERWERSGHVLRPPPESYEAPVNFEEAAGLVADERLVIAGRLGLFTNQSYGYMGKRTIVDVPAWVITVRQCVPVHGPPGLEDRPRCASDHLHMVVNAETGGHMQGFAP